VRNRGRLAEATGTTTAGGWSDTAPSVRGHAARRDHVRLGRAVRRREARGPKPLSPRSINMTVVLLAAVLEGAVERELIPRNPAKAGAQSSRTGTAANLPRQRGPGCGAASRCGELDRNAIGLVGMSNVER